MSPKGGDMVQGQASEGEIGKNQQSKERNQGIRKHLSAFDWDSWPKEKDGT